MLGDVPNLAFALGYTNASFTLRSDLSSRGVCRLLNFMDSTDSTSPRRRPKAWSPCERRRSTSRRAT